jgi:hypothetical protein
MSRLHRPPTIDAVQPSAGRRSLLVVAIGAAAGCLAPAMAQTEKLPPAARDEIARLLQFVEASGCEFYRNGSWHNARAAREHLTMKYDYALERGMIGSTDDFITKIATGSSMTGFAYKVRCDGRPPLTSADWLRTELVRIRGNAASPTK